MSRSRPLRLLLAAALTAGLAGACGAEEADAELGVGDLRGLYPAPAPPVATATELPGEAAYASSAGLLAGGGSVSADADGTTLLATDRGLVAYDPTTHEERWRTDVAGGVCALSEVVDGRVALLLDARGTYGRCDRVGVVDVDRGALRWSRPLGDAEYLFDRSVALGRDRVYAGGECGAVLTFAVDSGAPRTPLLARDEVCGHANAMAGGVVALYEDGETPDTPDDAGTGWIPPYDGAARLRVLDAADGSERWSTTVERRGADLHGIVSAEPLVLDVSQRGHRTMRRYGPGGRFLGHLGAQLGPSDGFTVVARSDDVLVGTYEAIGGYRAYDLRTGQELWRVPTTDRWLAGADDDGLVWTQPARVRGDPDGPTWAIQSQVVRTSATDPADAVLVGALPGDDVTAGSVLGDDLLVRDAGRTEVLPLGAGVGPAPEPWTYAAGAVPWADGDVRPDGLADVCASVGRGALATVGLRTDLPAPADCHWLETADPAYLDAELQVDVEAVAPEAGIEGSQEAVTAADAARARYDHTHRRWPDLTGLGDAARTRTTQSADARRSSAGVEVLAGNVVVRVGARVEAQISDTLDGVVPAADLQRVVTRVAEDVLADLDLPGATPDLPGAGAPGPVGAAPDVCRLLADALPAAVPADRRTDLSAGDAVSTCRWEVPSGRSGTSLTVTAFAVPAARVADRQGRVRSAVAVARGLPGAGERYPAGGAGAYFSDTSDPGEYVSQVLTLRRANLVVTVDGTAFEEPLPTDLEADLVRVGRRVLDGASRDVPDATRR